MIIALLGLVGAGGLVGLILRVFGWTAIKGLGGSAISAASKVSPKIWLVIAVVIALVIGFVVHRNRIHTFKVETQRAQMAADNDHWRKKLADAHADAIKWKGQFEAEQTANANQERKRHEEVIRGNAATADALRLHGAGAARSDCRPGNHPGAVTSTSRPR